MSQQIKQFICVEDIILYIQYNLCKATPLGEMEYCRCREVVAPRRLMLWKIFPQRPLGNEYLGPSNAGGCLMHDKRDAESSQRELSASLLSCIKLPPALKAYTFILSVRCKEIPLFVFGINFKCRWKEVSLCRGPLWRGYTVYLFARQRWNRD